MTLATLAPVTTTTSRGATKVLNNVVTKTAFLIAYAIALIFIFGDGGNLIQDILGASVGIVIAGVLCLAVAGIIMWATAKVKTFATQASMKGKNND